jgi:hypothetical protein
MALWSQGPPVGKHRGWLATAPLLVSYWSQVLHWKVVCAAKRWSCLLSYHSPGAFPPRRAQVRKTLSPTLLRPSGCARSRSRRRERSRCWPRAHRSGCTPAEKVGAVSRYLSSRATYSKSSSLPRRRRKPPHKGVATSIPKASGSRRRRAPPTVSRLRGPPPSAETGRSASVRAGVGRARIMGAWRSGYDRRVFCSILSRFARLYGGVIAAGRAGSTERASRLANIPTKRPG